MYTRHWYGGCATKDHADWKCTAAAFTHFGGNDICKNPNTLCWENKPVNGTGYSSMRRRTNKTAWVKAVVVVATRSWPGGPPKPVSGPGPLPLCWDRPMHGSRTGTCTTTTTMLMNTDPPPTTLRRPLAQSTNRLKSLKSRRRRHAMPETGKNEPKGPNDAVLENLLFADMCCTVTTHRFGDGRIVNPSLRKSFVGGCVRPGQEHSNP